MAYYYLTQTNKIFKSVGARKVKQVCHNLTKLANSGMWGFSTHTTVSLSGACSFTNPSGIIYTPYIPLQTTTNSISSFTTTTGRTLNSTWSVEIAQDLQAMHGIDLNADMIPFPVPKNRNTYPIQKFKARNTITIRTKEFSDIIFELSTRRL